MQMPWTERAEQEVVGCAVASRRGAELAAAIVTPADFFGADGMTPLPNARMFAATIGLEVTDSFERITWVAAVADVPEEMVARIVAARSLMWDTRGRFARIVAAEARAREVMRAAAAAFEIIQNGGAEATDKALERIRSVA